MILHNKKWVILIKNTHYRGNPQLCEPIQISLVKKLIQLVRNKMLKKQICKILEVTVKALKMRISL